MINLRCDLRLVVSLAAALGSAALVAGCSDSASDASLRVENQSDFDIVELHVTSVGSSTWGSNLLGGNPLAPGSSVVIGVSCDTYDALLVDDSGVDCQLHSVDLCLNDAAWIIQNDTCTTFGAAKAAREAEAAKAKAAGSAATGATP
jgi:hypothetical protein